MNGRIKEVRKAAGLTQSEFGARLGVKGNTITQIELGNRGVSNQLILGVCREFGISRRWLETGEGDMIDPQVTDDIQQVTRTMEGQSEAKKRLVRFVVNMPPDLAEAFLEYLDSQTAQKDPRA